MQVDAVGIIWENPNLLCIFLGEIIFSERNWQKRNHPNKRANLAKESSQEILLEFNLLKCYGSLR